MYASQLALNQPSVRLFAFVRERQSQGRRRRGVDGVLRKRERDKVCLVDSEDRQTQYMKY